MKTKKENPNRFGKVVNSVSNEIKSLYPHLTEFENLTLSLTVQRNLILAETHQTIQNLLSQLCTNGVDLSCINTSLLRLDNTIKFK